MEALALNTMKLTTCRTTCLVFEGIIAGIFGMSALQGIAFMVLAQLFVGIIYAAALGFKAEPYFSSLTQIVASGVVTNGMTFMLVWVTFYNIVHIL